MQPKQSATRSPAPSSGSPGQGGATGPTHRFRESWPLMVGLAVVDAFALFLASAVIINGNSLAAIVILVITALLNWVFLSDRLYPIRWLSPGLVLMAMLVLYPLVSTVYVALTNYSDGHLLSKDQVIAQLVGQFYQPKDAASYKLTVYRNAAGDFLLLLDDQQGHVFTGTQKDGLRPYTLAGPPPAAIGDYQKLETAQTFQYLTALSKIEISGNGRQVRVTGPDAAQELLPKYTYNQQSDTLTDGQTGVVYKPVTGNFTAPDGSQLSPGFTAVVGFGNFAKVFTDPNVTGPFIGVFLWTVVFAAGTVFFAFTVGLGLALVFNDQKLPFKSLFRSICILPYTIPGFISVLIWVGLLNPYYGPLSLAIKSIAGVAPDWFSNGTLIKIAILLINTWLGFPYMMLLCLGALQAIPSDMYEAADLDGASPWAKFRYLTLPLLLVSVGPLLIGAFAFNFNNFTVIDLVNEGGPPIPGANTPAGQSDILISYTYRLAFAGGKGADFGLASTIAIFIFAIIALITIFNFRFTKQLEEVMS
ncbi:MAG: maltose ABC transporter permease MalF [Candidatus Chloroheliales bacterium]|nr:MAG: maltose ABC transporter permease MalF [Chloroflexota bacterium]